MGYAFISYSHNNRNDAEKLYSILSQHNIDVRMAPKDIPAGAKYPDWINNTIKGCSCFVLLLTEDSQNSHAVDSEVENATLKLNKPIIPVQVGELTLNDGFLFYLIVNQIVSVQSIQENSPEMLNVVNSVKEFIQSDTAKAPTDSLDKKEKRKQRAYYINKPVRQTGRRQGCLISLLICFALIVASVLSMFFLFKWLLPKVTAGGNPDDDTSKRIVEHMKEPANVRLRQSTGLKHSIAAGNGFSIGLKEDGTVVAAGDNTYGQCKTTTWENIVSVAAGGQHTIGLCSDGTVVSTGQNSSGQCDISDWHDIIAVSAGLNHTVGLLQNGTVVAVGDNNYGQCNVSQWKNVQTVAAGDNLTAALMKDGTVRVVGSPEHDTSTWKDVISISAGTSHIVALCKNGTVLASGKNSFGGLSKACNISDWSDIVSVSASSLHTIGLRADGTVVATGALLWDGYGNVDNWKNIVAIATGNSHTIGLYSDGTAVAVGSNTKGQCNVLDWTDIQANTDHTNESVNALKSSRIILIANN